jgi:putative transposase
MREYLLLVVALARTAMRLHSDVVAENVLLRQQLAVLTRPARRRPRLRRRDRLVWVLARSLRRDWCRHPLLVRPETVVRWHRRAWRVFWRWRSRSRLGRPRLSMEVRELIARMARCNPLWGSERIRGELLTLGITGSKRSIRRYRGCPPRGPSQAWRAFLANHAHTIWTADLFTVQTLAFRTLYVLLLISHGRRELLHVNVTAHPTAAWVWRHLIDATTWGRQPRYLVRDRDRVYGGDVGQRAKRLGIETLLSPVWARGRTRSPNASSEPSVGSASIISLC